MFIAVNEGFGQSQEIPMLKDESSFAAAKFEARMNPMATPPSASGELAFGPGCLGRPIEKEQARVSPH